MEEREGFGEKVDRIYDRWVAFEHGCYLPIVIVVAISALCLLVYALILSLS